MTKRTFVNCVTISGSSGFSRAVLEMCLCIKVATGNMSSMSLPLTVDCFWTFVFG
jgi:hypothetical protein